jgi:ABC-type glycerol-3-phosphate transport system substrate-binding protein
MHKNAQVMGTTYAIPFHNSTPILYYNKTMFDRAGIKQPPQTWAELLADAKKLTDESKGQWGIMLPSTNDDYGGWIFSALVRANGGKYFNEDYPGEVYYNAPTTIGAALLAGSDLQRQSDALRRAQLEADQRQLLLRQGRDGDAQHRRAGLYAREQQRF